MRGSTPSHSALLMIATVFVALLGGVITGCDQADLPILRPYEDPEARFPKEFIYQCPDYESDAWVCPFDGEPNDKVVFSGRNLLEKGGSKYDPEDYNYDLLYDSLKLIDSVPPGEELVATTFYFSAAPWGVAMRDALVCAAQRGVDVKIIIGNPIEPNEDGELEEHPSTKETLESLVEYAEVLDTLTVNGCTGGCLRDDSVFGGKQHSKFFAATKVCNGEEFDEHVVGVSSNNWTSSLVKRDNSTIFKRNDPRLYRVFRRYYQDMVDAETRGAHLSNYYDAEDGEGGVLGTGAGSDRNYRYHLFPRAGGEDPIDKFFRSVICEDTHIRISMSRWTTARSEIVDTLADLAVKGCKIQIIVGDEPTEVELRQYIVRKASLLRGVDFEYRRLPSPDFHDKYFMVDGRVYGPPERIRYLWSGSHNYSYSSLHTNEECAFEVYDSDLDFDGEPDNQLYEDFLDHFEWQWARAGLLSDFVYLPRP